MVFNTRLSTAPKPLMQTVSVVLEKIDELLKDALLAMRSSVLSRLEYSVW